MAIVTIVSGGSEHNRKITIPGVTAKRNPRIDEKLIVEIGVPIEPDSGWKCGTDLVWPVLRFIKPTDIQPVPMPYVCRHQIEAGD